MSYALRQSLGIDVAAINHQFQLLHAAGCVIETHPQHGVRLVEAGLACWADYIERRHAGSVGQRALVYRQTGSTQVLARQLIDGAADPSKLHGTIVVADQQSAGRGRLGRNWCSKPGESLLLTALVDRRNYSADHLMLASCHAVASAVEQVTGSDVQVRWPNDILLNDRKLAGILLEVVGETALVGIGLNVKGDVQVITQQANMPATSLTSHGCMVDRLTVLDHVCNCLAKALYHTSSTDLANAWRRRSILLQQRLTVSSDGKRLTGRVLDVDPEHGLLLQVEHGPVATLPAATTSLIHEENHYPLNLVPRS